MKIAILGSRGIPNQYGGFEQFAEYLALGLVKRNHDVTVYNPHRHKYQEDNWKGVNIIYCFDPEYKLGTTGQFIYDLNCIINARKKGFDILLFLGYTSSSVWGLLYPAKSISITNMDGLEWKRTKYSISVQKFLKYAEKLAIKFSDYLVADSKGIQSYLKSKYNISSKYIPYGANIFVNPDKSILDKYSLKADSYHMLMARMEPENNIEMILDGYVSSNSNLPFILIGNIQNKYGAIIKRKYSKFENIQFFGPLYNIDIINNLRYFSKIYFHGHSVGGTNPSLLEAISSYSLIAANDNLFNRAILENDAFYFKSYLDVKDIIETINHKETYRNMILNNIQKIKETYNWERIIEEYEELFIYCLNNKK